MKIDAHQHFWIYNNHEYGWIDDKMKVLKRDYLPDDLYPELVNSGFSGSIAVQARQSIHETKWLLELSSRYDFIKGVVGWVDLQSSDNLKKQLDQFCSSGKLVGVRHVVHDEPDVNFMLHDDFLNGISILKDYNLAYDLLLFPLHLPVAVKLVSAFPDQRFVIDHISKPCIKNRVFNPWGKDLKKLSENRNVWCKLSGMVTENNWEGWKKEEFFPYLDIVFEAFGPDRLITGSDWPVCTLAGSYEEVTNIVESYLSDKLPDIRQKVLGLNCCDFYGIS
jgi:L-fuconolactonase